MPLFKFLERKRTAETPESRRAFLLEHGRITDGTIIDNEITPAGEVAIYTYTLNGVDFESSELLTDQQLLDPVRYAPGAKVGVRYDPRNQGNSMLE